MKLSYSFFHGLLLFQLNIPHAEKNIFWFRCRYVTKYFGVEGKESKKKKTM